MIGLYVLDNDMLNIVFREWIDIRVGSCFEKLINFEWIEFKMFSNIVCFKSLEECKDMVLNSKRICRFGVIKKFIRVDIVDLDEFFGERLLNVDIR